MNTPQFSIVIPVYNVERYLRECLDSVLAQTFKDYETVLVDDGSTDNSGRICDEYAALHPDTIRVTHQKNQGNIVARHNGIAAACGRYVLCVDSDDYIAPDLLQSVNDAITAHDADLVMYWALTVDEKGKKTGHYSRSLFPAGAVDKDRLIDACLAERRINTMWLKVFRRDLYNLRLFDDLPEARGIKKGGDIMQSVSIVLRAERPYYIDRPLYFYRANPTSVGHIYHRGSLLTLRLFTPYTIAQLREAGRHDDRMERLLREAVLRVVYAQAFNAAKNVPDKDELYSIFDEMLSYDTARQSRRHLSLLTPHVGMEDKLGLLLLYPRHYRLFRLYCRLNVIRQNLTRKR